ncbi:unnamed protein product, partial [Cylindrotheca closterium]
MGNKRYRQDANKAAQSKSQTMRRKSSLGSTASDPKEQHNAILPELVGEKLRQMNDSSHHSCTDSGSRSQRRSLSRKISQRSSSRSSKVSISVRDELEDKMDRMQASDLPSASSLKKKYGSRGNHATPQRSSSNTSKGNRSSRSVRQRSFHSSCSSSDRHRRRNSRNDNRDGKGSTAVVDNGSIVINMDSSEISIDETTPGAYRVGSMGRINALSPNTHYEQSDGSHSDEERDLQTRIPPRSSRSRGSQSNAIE